MKTAESPSNHSMSFLGSDDTDTIRSIQSDIKLSIQECSIRGLRESVKLLAELLVPLEDRLEELIAVKSISMNESDLTLEDPTLPITPKFSSRFLLAKSCLDTLEYDRAAYHARSASESPAQPELRFIYFYSRYMAIEKKRLDLQAESNAIVGSVPPLSTLHNDPTLADMNDLKHDLDLLYQDSAGPLCIKLDSYLLNVYGTLLAKLDLKDQALEAFRLAVNLNPLNWPAWQEMALLLDDKSSVESIIVPNHIFKHFFMGSSYVELQMSDAAIEIYSNLLNFFPDCLYINSQLAVTLHDRKDAEGSIEIFNRIREIDPFRLDALDIYSNNLYLKECRNELAVLAHSMNTIDPFRSETCFVVANFYSLRRQHQKAATFLSRALQLNPRHLSSWILMGHEYMEMKNTGAAIQAYRSAIKYNKRDYRAWYGLGMTYEILKMPSYALYYYSTAMALNPDDSRVSISTGAILEKLDRDEEAIKCYAKAGGVAVIKIASVYSKMGANDKAAEAYRQYLDRVVPGMTCEPNQHPYASEVADAYHYLAKFHFDKKEYIHAYGMAQNAMHFVETREDSKTLLKQIISAAKAANVKLD